MITTSTLCAVVLEFVFGTQSRVSASGLAKFGRGLKVLVVLDAGIHPPSYP